MTLTIGILTSMFTALVATRLVFDALLNIGVIGTDGSKKLVHLRVRSACRKSIFKI